jgi:hypothetical protein
VNVDSNATGKGNTTAAAKTPKLQAKSQGIVEWIFFPNKKSISGLGEVASAFSYEDSGPEVKFLLVSFLLSIIVAFPFRFAESSKRRIPVMLSAIALAITFAWYVRLAEEVKLAWGFWVLIILLVVQLAVEIRFKT